MRKKRTDIHKKSWKWNESNIGNLEKYGWRNFAEHMVYFFTKSYSSRLDEVDKFVQNSIESEFVTFTQSPNKQFKGNIVDWGT